jgi:hypothetical protein
MSKKILKPGKTEDFRPWTGLSCHTRRRFNCKVMQDLMSYGRMIMTAMLG